MTRKRSTQRGIPCPDCGSDQSTVNESRHTPADNTIRRRRECKECGNKYTTYETTTSPRLVSHMADHATSHLVGGNDLRLFLIELQQLIAKHQL